MNTIRDHPQQQDAQSLLKDRLMASHNVVKSSWSRTQSDLVALVARTLAGLDKAIQKVKSDTLGQDARLERLDKCADTLGALLGGGSECRGQALAAKLSVLNARRSELLAARARAVDAYRASQNRNESDNNDDDDDGSATKVLRDNVGGRLKTSLEKIDAQEARAVKNLKRKYLAMRMASDDDGSSSSSSHQNGLSE